jgi:hypothetical protein
LSIVNMQAPSAISGNASYTLASGSKNPGAVAGAYTYNITAGAIAADGADVTALYAAGFLVIMKAPGGTTSVSMSGASSPFAATTSYAVTNGLAYVNPAHVPELASLGFIVAGSLDDTNTAPSQRPGSPVITGTA